MEHDFEKVLETMADSSDWVEENYEAIRFALRFTQKMMGKPSYELMKAGESAYKQPNQSPFVSIRLCNAFKVMRDRLIHEAEGG